jgi:hypothetical protein
MVGGTDANHHYVIVVRTLEDDLIESNDLFVSECRAREGIVTKRIHMALDEQAGK